MAAEGEWEKKDSMSSFLAQEEAKERRRQEGGFENENRFLERHLLR